MKKILISLSIIGIAAGVVAGGTIAFFNDTETSTGNIFTAGSIDLTVDHTKASYNGEECETCHLEIVSNNTTVVGVNAAVELSFVHPAWTADLDGEHVAGLTDGSDDGSKWIWITDGPTIPQQDQTHTFDRHFNWTGAASAVTLYLASDNVWTNVTLNGNLIASTAGNDDNFTTATEDEFVGIDPSFLVQGNNILSVTVTNVAGSSDPETNPAGLLFKLEIDGICDGQDGIFEYQDTPDNPTCQLWGEKDLDGSEYYFDFDDVKPGDYGMNLISLHVDSNDAYACLIPHDLVDDENDVVDSELEASDTLDTDGELSDYLEFFLWEDNGDGAYQNGESILVEPGARLPEIQTEMVAMQLVGSGPTEYIGVAWCAGTQTGPTQADPSLPLVCDGAGMNDIAQTDSLLASLTAYAEQIRNNPSFECENVDLQ